MSRSIAISIKFIKQKVEESNKIKCNSNVIYKLFSYWYNQYCWKILFRLHIVMCLSVDTYIHILLVNSSYL